LDAYRELNAKKLFWITLILSGLVCLALATIGRSGDGYQVLWFGSMRFADGVPAETLYGEVLFYYVGFKIWLTFGATILAIISTAGLFPDFIKEGCIDLVMSKPIGRLRLFFIKWATGLLFVTMQITLFTVGCFLVIGIRGNVWLWEMFWGIPLVILFFSYLYAVCVLIGLMTRSTVVAMLLTGLLWLGLIGLDYTERIMANDMTNKSYIVQVLEQRGPDAYATHGVTFDPFNPDDVTYSEEAAAPRTQLEADADLAQRRQTYATWRRFYMAAYLIKTALPKTGETTSLLRTKMYPDQVAEEGLEGMRLNVEYMDGYEWDPALAQSVRDDFQKVRGPLWVLGTSLLFEALVLALAAWKFCRRDY